MAVKENYIIINEQRPKHNKKTTDIIRFDEKKTVIVIN